MGTRIDLDVKVGQEVYIDHNKYIITDIDISIKENNFQVVQTETWYKLKFLEGIKPSPIPIEYERTEFLTEFEYRNLLIDLVNSLQQKTQKQTN